MILIKVCDRRIAAAVGLKIYHCEALTEADIVCARKDIKRCRRRHEEALFSCMRSSSDISPHAQRISPISPAALVIMWH